MTVTLTVAALRFANIQVAANLALDVKCPLRVVSCLIAAVQHG